MSHFLEAEELAMLAYTNTRPFAVAKSPQQRFDETIAWIKAKHYHIVSAEIAECCREKAGLIAP